MDQATTNRSIVAKAVAEVGWRDLSAFARLLRADR
jgi:hypothetical protein